MVAAKNRSNKRKSALGGYNFRITQEIAVA